MDPITHGLAGVVIRNLGFKSKAALTALVLASVFPDIDYITRLFGIEVFLRYHRGLTHGILALFVVPVLFGIAFGLRRGFFYFSSIAFLGYALHLFLDLTNQYGVRIFSPLDWQQYSLGLTFIIDPYVSIGFLVSVVFSRLNKKRAKTIALATLILLVSYIGIRQYFQDKSKDFLRDELDTYVCDVSPLPNDFLRWWFVAKLDGINRVGFVDLFTQRVYVQDVYIQGSSPYIELSKNEKIVENFLYFAKYPYADVKKVNGKIEVTWKELSYAFLPGEHFEAKVVMDKEGKVLKAGFKY
jgi:inner membrane protein